MKVRVDRIKLLRAELRFELKLEETWILANDLQRQGQIQPIAVKRIDDEWWELVAGRRRWEAAKLINWEHIEAFEGEYKEGVLVAAAAENIRRKQLSLLEESAYVEKLHGDGGMSINDIADATGHGNSWVQDRLAVLGFPQILKDLVHGGHVKIGAALTLSRVTDPEALAWYCHSARAGGCTAQTAEAWWLDWQARSKMMMTEGFDGNIPQPLPLPDSPPFHCFLCDERKEVAGSTFARVCEECVTEVKLAKLKAERLPPQTQETSSTEGTRD
jgi:ParB/RepB/Spo0J family partition protein